METNDEVERISQATEPVPQANKSRRQEQKPKKQEEQQSELENIGADAEVAMTIETFCQHRKHTKMIEARLRVYLLQHPAEVKHRTPKEWDEVYRSIMSRVTK